METADLKKTVRAVDLKILIIDDDEHFRHAMVKHLNKAGYINISSAEGGADGLAKVGDKPNLVIVDTHMPQMDGFEVCRSVRERTGAEAKILLITGSMRNINARKAREAGANAYTFKSADFAGVIHAIKQLYSMD